MNQMVSIDEVREVMGKVMGLILHVGQSSLSEHQFESFRKLVMDFFNAGTRQLAEGWCGSSKSIAREVVGMSEIATP